MSLHRERRNTASQVWLGLTFQERSVLREALAHYRSSDRAETDDIDAILGKIERAKPQPWVVEEIDGNPFPVRLYDYDIDGVDEPDFDEAGRACVISEFEPNLV